MEAEGPACPGPTQPPPRCHRTAPLQAGAGCCSGVGGPHQSRVRYGSLGPSSGSAGERRHSTLYPISSPAGAGRRGLEGEGSGPASSVSKSGCTHILCAYGLDTFPGSLANLPHNLCSGRSIILILQVRKLSQRDYITRPRSAQLVNRTYEP